MHIYCTDINVLCVYVRSSKIQFRPKRKSIFGVPPLADDGRGIISRITSRKKKKKLIGKKIRPNIWPAPERTRRVKDTAKLTNYHL